MNGFRWEEELNMILKIVKEEDNSMLMTHFIAKEIKRLPSNYDWTKHHAQMVFLRSWCVGLLLETILSDW